LFSDSPKGKTAPWNTDKITINGRNLNRVVIDHHCRLKHGQSMNDEIILDLVKTMDGKKFPPEKI
jgi:hypothetical protein